MRKVIPDGSNPICMFCGNQEKRRWDEYTSYYECDCVDAKYNRDLIEQMRQLQSDLKRKLRKPKYEITMERVLKEIE